MSRLFILIWTVLLSVVQACPDGFTELSNELPLICYKYINTYLNWADARLTCQSFGADLFSITSEAENIALSTIGPMSWLGYNDIASEGHYVWADGTVSNFTSWGNGEPSNSTYGIQSNGDNINDCAAMYFGTNWFSYPCAFTRLFACSIRLSSQSPSEVPTLMPSKMPTEIPSQIPTVIPSIAPTWPATQQPTTWTGTGCPPGFAFSSATLCTRLSPNYGSWFDGDAYCQSQYGSMLASITSALENDAIAALTLYGWIGLTNLSASGVFQWQDGSPATYTNWASSVEHSDGLYTLIGSFGKWEALDGYVMAMRGVCGLRVCPSGFVLLGNACYKHVPTLMSWSEARANCRSHGAELVSIHSAYENDLLGTYLTSLLGNYWHLQPGEIFWIGLTGHTTYSDYEWSDGSPVYYNNWNPAYTSVEWDCVAMENNGMWDDRICSNPYGSICIIRDTTFDSLSSSTKISTMLLVAIVVPTVVGIGLCIALVCCWTMRKQSMSVDTPAQTVTPTLDLFQTPATGVPSSTTMAYASIPTDKDIPVYVTPQQVDETDKKGIEMYHLVPSAPPVPVAQPCATDTTRTSPYVGVSNNRYETLASNYQPYVYGTAVSASASSNGTYVGNSDNTNHNTTHHTNPGNEVMVTGYTHEGTV